MAKIFSFTFAIFSVYTNETDVVTNKIFCVIFLE